MEAGKIRAMIAGLPPAEEEACNELADWIRRQLEVAGEPVGSMAIALVEAELREDGKIIRGGRTWPQQQTSTRT
jgi:hypothetical protein